MPTAEIGPTGELVAENIKRLRAGVSLRDLEAKLRDLGRPILASGLLKVEQGRRRVDVDDLAAIAAALGVTPEYLLRPAAFSERLSATELAEHREAVNAVERAVAAAVDGGLPLRGLLEYVDYVHALARLRGRPDLQEMAQMAHDAGERLPHMPPLGGRNDGER